MIEVVVYTNDVSVLNEQGFGKKIREHFEEKGLKVGLVSLRHDEKVGTREGFAESGKAWSYE